MQKTLQQLIDETPEGGVLHLGEVVYKETVTIAKNITIVGAREGCENDAPWDNVYKTSIEGLIDIVAPKVNFENCSFSFDNSTVVLEKGISPKFTRCCFVADKTIFAIKGDNTSPLFTACVFSTDEFEIGIVVIDGACVRFKNCYSQEFCPICVKGYKTKVFIVDSLFSAMYCVALFVAKGAHGFFENSSFCNDYDTDSVRVMDLKTVAQFIGCDLVGSPSTLYAGSGAQASFDHCFLGVNCLDAYNQGFGFHQCDILFYGCNFKGSAGRLFKGCDGLIDLIDCKFTDDDRIGLHLLFGKGRNNQINYQIKQAAQLKQILSSSNPIAEIESRKDEFFDFIDCYMVGCEHKNFHCEGDVWEHTKLVIQNVVAEEHDWIDVLAVLLHDVGKKNALERNNGKNMHGHEIDGANIAFGWLAKMGFDREIREQVLWLIRNHMKALDLKVMRSKYDIWQLVKHPLFGRLRHLACADCKATLDAEGHPRDDFEEILNRPIVAECLENEMPVAIVEADDFASQKWDDIRVENALAFCHKMQINGGVFSKESLVRAAIKTIGGSNG